MAQKTYTPIGVVKEIYRYPVKSMAGELIEEGWIGWHGLEGDRRYAFLKTESKRGFPWLTARDNPKMLLYKPYFVDPAHVRESLIFVRTPGERDLPLCSNEFIQEISRLYRFPISLIHLWSGIFDAMDVSILTEASVQNVGVGIDIQLDIRRFRSNIVIQVDDPSPYPEDRWIKDLIVFGNRSDSARIRANRKDLRCMIVNLDPDTGAQEPMILKEIVQNRKNLVGIYGSVERPGSIRVGDIVQIASC